MQRWSPLMLIGAAVVGLALLALLARFLLGVALDAFVLVWVLVQLVLFLAFVALVTWVVANVWKSVMRR